MEKPKKIFKKRNLYKIYTLLNWIAWPLLSCFSGYVMTFYDHNVSIFFAIFLMGLICGLLLCVFQLFLERWVSIEDDETKEDRKEA